MTTRPSRSVVIGILVALCCLLATPVSASEPLTIGETRIINDYPQAVTFEVEAASNAAAITSVRFNLSVRGGNSTAIAPAEFTPGRQITARYVWNTRRDGIPPGTPIQYTWTIRDETGETITTQPADHVVIDPHFTWQMLQDDDVALWWYEGDAGFGQRIFDSAAQAMAAMKQHTATLLPYRVHVVLYGDDADFDAWHNYVREWVGGEAYPRTGLTVQIVPPDDSVRVEQWVQQVIPHEIAHLFFHQVTDTPLASAPPTWLDEGFAQYHEFVPHEDELAWVQQAAERGVYADNLPSSGGIRLIPLRLLSGSFNGDDERIALMYAESLSAVTFLFEHWGDAGVGQLLAAYKAGRSTDEALHEATGLSFEEFQQAWWEWLGGQPGAYPTRVPRPELPTARPIPTPRAVFPAVVTQPPTTSPVPTEAPTASPRPTEPATAPPVPSTHPTTLPTPAAVGATPEPVEGQAGSSSAVPCTGTVGILGMVAVLGWRKLAMEG